jgi:hypothetical protein
MKTAEEKALEEYPLPKEETESTSFINQETFNSAKRTGYIVGYNQAFQDFLEKAEEFFYEQFNIHPHDCHVVQYVSDTPLEDIDGFVEQFKNYMQNESEN